MQVESKSIEVDREDRWIMEHRFKISTEKDPVPDPKIEEYRCFSNCRVSMLEHVQDIIRIAKERDIKETELAESFKEIMLGSDSSLFYVTVNLKDYVNFFKKNFEVIENIFLPKVGDDENDQWHIILNGAEEGSPQDHAAQEIIANKKKETATV